MWGDTHRGPAAPPREPFTSERDRHGKECKNRTPCVFQTHSLCLAMVHRALKMIIALVLLSRLFTAAVLKVRSGS